MFNNQFSIFHIHVRVLLVITSLSILVSCSVQKQISRSATNTVLNNAALQTAHVGISIFDTETNKYLYNYQGDKYFIPASNTKIPTCYAAMKYLGDSLVGLRYVISDSAITIFPSGDPTFLHPEFPFQPLFTKLKLFKRVDINNSSWQDEALGSGWSWNDYNENYMAERSPLPIYGNLIRFTLKNGTITSLSDLISLKSDEEFESSIKFNPLTKQVASNQFKIERTLGENVFSIKNARNTFSDVSIPIRTNLAFVQGLLKDTLNIQDGFSLEIPAANSKENNTSIVHSQPTDSLLKPMMHRSDNFFAEQSLLMVSNEFLGVMNDAKIIDTILKTDFKDLPQKPRWVDGSGLSRYNLFTPQDFVSILNKMKNEFGMERIKEIFPTGGEGTLSSYYKKDSSFIYAKTGTLSGVVAISGFMYTSKNKLFLFSILVNNHQASATEVRRSIERFLQGVRNRY